MLSLNFWHEGVLAPIDTNNPVGTNIRLDDTFDLLQQEVSNDIAMDREATDWNKVLTLTSEVLTQQSKDLLVLVYSIRSVISAYRYEGIARAITLLPLYLDTYWESGFPLLKRKRARLGALEWLTQHLELWLETNEPLVDEKMHLESVITGIKVLNSKLAVYGEDWVLDTFTITKKLNAYLVSMPNNDVASFQVEPPKAKATPTNNAPSSEFKPTAIRSSDARIDVIDEKSFQAGVRSAQGKLKSLAKYKLSKDLRDPLAYEISRFSTWLPILELPHHKEHITPLRPIPLEKQQALALHFQQKRYETLIVEVEASLLSSPFWLDGHRIVVESLQAMDSDENKNHQKAIDSISKQVKAFITRLEGIERLSFFDGTPFADRDTLKWLAGLEVSDSAIAEVSLQEPDIAFVRKPETKENKNSCDDEHTVFEMAQSSLKENRFADGLSTLDAYCSHVSNVSSRTHWFRVRMLMAEYCLSAKEYFMAEQLLLELDEISVSHKLELWEPEKVIELLSMMLICKNKLKRKQDAKDYFNRLSRLDIMQAYVIKKGE